MCAIDENLSRLVQQQVRHERSGILRLIEPFNARLQIVVERTFNESWLVDGLQEAGYEVCLAHPLGLYMLTGAQVKTDRRDALALAKLLKAGMIPKAYIHAKDTRPIRDLLRQRSRLVALRGAAQGSLRRLLLRHGLLGHSRHDIKETTEEDLQRWFAHPLVRLHDEHERQRIALYTQQIATLKAPLLATVQDRPDVHRWLTIPGLGKILALSIVYASGAMARCQNAREVSSSCRSGPGGAHPARSAGAAGTPSRGARPSSGPSAKRPSMPYGTTRRADAVSTVTWGAIVEQGANTSPMPSSRINRLRPSAMPFGTVPSIARSGGLAPNRPQEAVIPGASRG